MSKLNLLTWSDDAWDDYLYWQDTDKKVLKKINKLIKECQRTPTEGIGHPEPLKHDFSGYWSRKIKGEHRLVYSFDATSLMIAACRYHYDQ
ncbi:toxin YoeB (plasmid) [Piscirickettsia salmonis]|uniref:Putative mRNA interferase YoeB n=1 Tax=Piscirickettsia salmonis TaxID=1238 RepID=A0A6I5YBD1_PISSA|nr:Txe/YoeB family addiction module toxin [Piscirickettsia salmonis]RNC76803.1 Txe/YoeB family addiction module toxin [Piscirickettsiaceae bacterium NZ-RLO2]ALB24352.1 toxin YoeB [Piscirickettsia salmonis]ALY04323.1 toxin YoeB [Piscirickettsia salmonis]AMA44070.1 toxin YoeB [Piscirickettsia salmonis]AOS36883.1 toxin YoeB [Piscirickettsia salmonis]